MTSAAAKRTRQPQQERQRSLAAGMLYCRCLGDVGWPHHCTRLLMLLRRTSLAKAADAAEENITVQFSSVENITSHNWKILENLISDVHTQRSSYWNDRHGTLSGMADCASWTLRKNRCASTTIEENSLSVRGPRYFSLLLAKVCNIIGIALERTLERTG